MGRELPFRQSEVDAWQDNYRDGLRLHVRTFFEHYTLGEITTGREEWFLKAERAASYSRAKHSDAPERRLWLARERPARSLRSQ